MAVPTTILPPPEPSAPPGKPVARHSILDDAQGILLGAAYICLGVVFLQSGGLVSSGAAGLALVVHQATDMSFGLAFFLVNLPFYYFAWARLGLRFTLKSFLSVGLTSVIASIFSHWFAISYIHPAISATIGGSLIGVGLLFLFRHDSSVGGFGVLGLYLQDRFGWRAGIVQLCLDAVVMLLALLNSNPVTVAWSVYGAVVANFVIGVNHRRDRYVTR